MAHPSSLETLIKQAGGIAPRSALISAGFTPRALASAVLSSRIVRARRAWYAVPDADPDRVTAVMLGGRLGAFSALESYGIWRGPDRDLHVSWAPHGTVASSGRRSTGFPLGGGIVSYWRHDGFADGPDPWRESVQQSLAQIAACASDLEVLCACDSAVDKGLLSAFELHEIFALGPARGRGLASEVDGSADSGLETILRVWARRLGLRVRTQVVLGGHPVDMVIEESLAIETDGREFHSDEIPFERDRLITGRLQAHGFTVYRPTYSMIMFRWAEVEATLAALIGQGRHRDSVVWFQLALFAFPEIFLGDPREHGDEPKPRESASGTRKILRKSEQGRNRDEQGRTEQDVIRTRG
jgi:very-short-patch-repair endonuclease